MRKDKENHLDEECEYEKTNCDHEECNWIGPKKDKETHIMHDCDFEIVVCSENVFFFFFS